nr:hypothetical protein [Tanacetum cinerariifolium]
MMKLNEYVIMIICVSFLVLLVRYECSKIDVNDIKSIASAPCRTKCLRTIEVYCCCGDYSNNHTLCSPSFEGCYKRCTDLRKCCVR